MMLLLKALLTEQEWGSCDLGFGFWAYDVRGDVSLDLPLGIRFLRYDTPSLFCDIP